MSEKLEFIKVSTIVQAKFHLIRKEVICFKIEDGMGYVASLGGDKVKMIIQPTHGSASEVHGNFGLLKKFMEENGDKFEFYVCKGASLVSKKNTLLDKFADFISKNKQEE